MAKTYTWEIPETVMDEETEQEKEVTHGVSLVCSMLTGKARITIDGTEFDISTRPFGLRGTNQVFRLGEMAAIVDFPKKGEPDLVIDGTCVRSGKPYAG
ncbi:MAG: hypothetical protein IJX94_04130 [Clostridia bacterium]|nr:hypothetical protein [Clostridia bacterium]